MEKEIVFAHVKSKYNPALDHLEGKILFKEKYEQAKDILSKTVFPKEVLDIINREISR
jgi:hypothetical protein